MDDANGDVSTIVFVCLHGSAKSLIAAEHLNRLARLRGASIRGESLGLEPDADVPPNVVIGLAADGIDVHGSRKCGMCRELRMRLERPSPCWSGRRAVGRHADGQRRIRTGACGDC
jgi:hypothetical protein